MASRRKSKKKHKPCCPPLSSESWKRRARQIEEHKEREEADAIVRELSRYRFW